MGALGLGQRTELGEVLSRGVSPVVWRKASPFTLEKPNQIPLLVLVGEGEDGGIEVLLTPLIGRNNLAQPMGTQICN